MAQKVARGEIYSPVPPPSVRAFNLGPLQGFQHQLQTPVAIGNLSQKSLLIIIKPTENAQLQTILNTIGKEEQKYFVNKTADYQASKPLEHAVMLRKDRRRKFVESLLEPTNTENKTK